MKTKLSLSNVCLCALTAILLYGFVGNSQAQNGHAASSPEAKALMSWIALDAPPGWEHLATDLVMKNLAGWQRDAAGNLIIRKGSGSPRRVVACGLDRPVFAVTEITEDGYLRVRESGSLRQHPLWVQFHEGQRAKVITRNRNLPGVFTVKSTHLQRGRVTGAPVAVLDDLWLDIGARTRAEVLQLGIQMLDPVVRELPSWSYADFVAGPAAGLRVGCAAVASAARGDVTSGETIFLLTTLRSFGQDGLTAALRPLGRVDEITIIDPSGDQSTTEKVVLRKLERPAFIPASAGVTSAVGLGPRVTFAGSMVESVRLSDAEDLLSAVERAASVRSANSALRWPAVAVAKESKVARLDPLAATANLLATLADVPSVSGHEAKIRQAIQQSLPAWAKSKIVTDTAGNLILELGPDRDPMMFIAHQDEVGYEITSIAADGKVSLRTRGGMFQSLWEGQPALLHFDGDSVNQEPLKGVFVPRDTATSKQPEALTAWFGLDAAGLNRAGVKAGQSVTAFKQATRLAGSRFTARALDDRAGTTAQLLALRKIDPAKLTRRVIFTWSVSEETGLVGAIELAKKYGASLREVYSVDTFVASDSPLESTRFAFTKLGQGAVIRGLDSSSVARPAELDRVLRLARANAIPLQVGATNGGADGSEFVHYGVTHVALSWPGRYSHSPVEVLDLKDLQSLANLIFAIATSR